MADEVKARAASAFKFKNSGKTCSIDGCDAPAIKRGWCRDHYGRWQRHGDPMGGGPSLGAPSKWVDDNIGFSGGECLTWPFGKKPSGYGMVTYNGHQTSAHRIMCALAHGPAPSAEHQAAHSCGRGHLSCVNPKHLRWALPAENAADMAIHGTVTAGEKHGQAKLTEDQVRDIRSRIGSAAYTEIGADFGVSPSLICAIVKKRAWKHVQ